MGLNEELEKMKFDTRLIDWNLKHKRLKPDELTRHLSAIPDCSQNVDRLSFTGGDDSVENGIGLQ